MQTPYLELQQTRQMMIISEASLSEKLTWRDSNSGNETACVVGCPYLYYRGQLVLQCGQLSAGAYIYINSYCNCKYNSLKVVPPGQQASIHIFANIV